MRSLLSWGTFIITIYYWIMFVINHDIYSGINLIAFLILTLHYSLVRKSFHIAEAMLKESEKREK